MSRLFTYGYGLQSVTMEPPGISSSPITTTGSATADLDTVTKRYGGASVKYTSAADGSTYTSLTFSSSSIDVHARIYVYFDSFPASGTCQIMTLRSSSTDRANIRVAADGTIGLYASTTQRGSSSAALSTGQWYGIELRNTYTGDSSCAARVWSDDDESISEFASGAVAAGVSSVRYGAVNSAAGMVCYITDTAVNSGGGSYETTYPGQGRLVYLHANAAGDSNEWQKSDGSAGSATNYQDIDDSPTPDDATTYLKRTSSAAPVDFFNMPAASTAGIASTDTVKFVSVSGRVGAASNTANADRTIKYGIKSQTSGTVSWSSDLSCATSAWRTGYVGTVVVDNHVVYVDPQDSSAWTASDIDTAQIGISTGTTATTEVRYSALWAVIEFQPAAAIAVTDSVASSWDVAAAVADSLPVSWNTLITATDSLPVSWDVMASVTDSVPVSWDVASNLIQVLASVGASWDTYSRVLESLPGSWDVDATVSDSLPLSWDVLTALTDSLPASWDVADPAVMASIAASWDVAAPAVLSSLAATWDTDNQLSETTVTLIGPNGEVVPTLLPTFWVLVSSDWNGWELQGEIRVSTDPTFATEEAWSPVSFTPQYTDQSVETAVKITNSLVDDTTYYWSARVGFAGVWSDWATYATFTTNTGFGIGAHYGFFSDVTAGAVHPVLWFVYPDTVEPGDTVTCYGTGMASVKVWYGTTEITPDSTVLVPATSDAFTIDREILASTASVDVEHYEVTFTVPDEDGVEYGTSIAVEEV